VISSQPTLMVFDRIGSFVEHFVQRPKARGWKVFLTQGQVNPEMIAGCDVLYCNWADALAVQLSNRRWPGKLVVMVRSYEAYAGFLGAIQWENVDLLVFVSPHIHQYCKLTYPIPDSIPVHIVPDCVDVERFPLRKNLTPGETVGFVGRLGAPKNVPWLVAAAYEFPEYTFRFKGPFEDRRLQAYMAYHEAQAGNIHVEGPSAAEGEPWFSGRGVSEFLEECDYIASPSFHEGTHMALLEGMSKGLYPLVQDRPGAVVASDWPTYRTMAEFGVLLRDGCASTAVRAWVVAQRNVPRQLAAIDAMLDLVAPSPIIVPRGAHLN